MSKSLSVTDAQRQTLISGTVGVAMPFVALAMVSSFLTGCNTISSIPVSRVPREILAAERKDDFIDISLLRLRQDPPEVYLLGPGDVLGVYIKGVLGNEEELPPVHFPEDSNRAPAIGYPVPVREDGTLALPIVDPIKVEGMSLVEATKAVHNAYTYPRVIVKEGEEQIIVTLIRERKIRVQVIREEGGGSNGVTKRGTGHVVDLPAYENDLLHALSETGGMPGTDAKNEVMIYRGMYEEGMSADVILDDLCHSQCQDQCVDPCFCDERPVPDPPYVTRIPLRYNPANPPTFTKDDISCIKATSSSSAVVTQRRSSRQVCWVVASILCRETKTWTLLVPLHWPMGNWEVEDQESMRSVTVARVVVAVARVVAAVDVSKPARHQMSSSSGNCLVATPSRCESI